MKKKRKFNAKIFLIKTTRIIIITYVTMLIFLSIKQKDMLYYPDYPRESSFYDCYHFNTEEKKEYNGTRFFEKKGTNKNVVIFFHGNAGSACDRYDLKNILDETLNSYIFVEYYGYADMGKNKPNIESILQDSLNIGKYINNNSYEKIYVAGRSVGTGPASYYAQNFKTDKLFLISPYSQLYKVVSSKYPIFPVKLVFTENYNNEKYLKEYKKQLLIIHGNDDKIIPFPHGKELYDGINTKNKELFIIKNGDHNNLLYIKEVKEKIRDYLK